MFRHDYVFVISLTILWMLGTIGVVVFFPMDFRWVYLAILIATVPSIGLIWSYGKAKDETPD